LNAISPGFRPADVAPREEKDAYTAVKNEYDEAVGEIYQNYYDRLEV
jgi:hypothetical protein